VEKLKNEVCKNFWLNYNHQIKCQFEYSCQTRHCFENKARFVCKISPLIRPRTKIMKPSSMNKYSWILIIYVLNRVRIMKRKIIRYQTQRNREYNTKLQRWHGCNAVLIWLLMISWFYIVWLNCLKPWKIVLLAIFSGFRN
jgi:hypothetical protein